MKRTLLAAFAAVALVGLAAPAYAQKAATPAAPAAKAAGPESTTGYKSKTVYDFDDDVVEGDLVRPDGEFVDTRKAAKHSSLIRIRPDFIPEMLKSAEDI